MILLDIHLQGGRTFIKSIIMQILDKLNLQNKMVHQLVNTF